MTKNFIPSQWFKYYQHNLYPSSQEYNILIVCYQSSTFYKRWERVDFFHDKKILIPAIRQYMRLNRKYIYNNQHVLNSITSHLPLFDTHGKIDVKVGTNEI